MKQLITALVFSLLCFATASAQDFTPLVTQFAKKDYKAHHQNWSISNDRNGVVYFGNGSCLLAYDGKIWSKYSMPFNKIVRSVLVVDDVIYVGSYEEFGCFTKKDNGQLEYRSISDLLSDYEMQNDEIWSIIYDRDKIIFKAFTSYFIFDGEKVIAHKTPYLLQFFCKYNDTLYTHAENLGLHTIDLETAELTKVESPFNSKLISIIERGDGTSYFITYSDGIYLFDGKEFIRFRTNIDEGLENWQVNRVTQAENGDLYIGTLLNGAICLDKYGKTKWIINTSNVLQSNTILGIHIDENENLWLALDSGIALIPTDNSMMYINALQPGVGTVYTTYYDEPHLYMGTGQGLYKSTLSEDFGKVSDIQIIPEIKGNVWDISKYDSQVFISTNSETYELLENGDFEVASPIKGGMCFARGRIAGKDVLVQGTYTHLCIYVKKGGKWVYSHYIDGFLDPVGTVAVDYSGTIWAGHMHRGLYSIKLGYDLKTVESCDYYDSLEKDEFLPIRVYTINERVVFADTKKLYTYDDINKSIIPYEDLNSRIGHFASAYRICESGYGHYWFITESEAARYDVGNKSISEFVSFDAFGNRTADMYQNVIPVTKNIDLFTFENSVALYRLGNQRKQANTNFFIKELKINDISESLDSLIALNEGKVKIPYKYRNLDFTLSCPPPIRFCQRCSFQPLP